MLGSPQIGLLADINIPVGLAGRVSSSGHCLPSKPEFLRQGLRRIHKPMIVSRDMIAERLDTIWRYPRESGALSGKQRIWYSARWCKDPFAPSVRNVTVVK
jgi:hypothetical protein